MLWPLTLRDTYANDEGKHREIDLHFHLVAMISQLVPLDSHSESDNNKSVAVFKNDTQKQFPKAQDNWLIN